MTAQQVLATTLPGQRQRAGNTIDGAALRLSAALLLAGQLLYIVVTQFHRGGEANDHRAIFAAYARSDSWKAVHVGQFLAMALITGGLVVLYFALSARVGSVAWMARLGAGCAGVALALYAVLQAVDGIGNKEVDAAWVSAPTAEKSAHFASAEAMRWLEWGVRSYHDYALGLAMLLLGGAVVRAGVARTIGYLMGLSGLAYLLQGWAVGAEGFSSTHTILILVAWAVSLPWMIWLAVAGWRTRGSETARQAG